MKKERIIPKTITGKLVFLFCIILCLLIIYPLFWIIMSSFKDYRSIYQDVWGLPDVWRFENYSRAWTRGISQYFVNSIIVTVTTLIGVLFAASTLAFGITQIKGKLGYIVFLAVMVCLLLSPQVCVLPLFILLRSMGLNQTYFAMIFPYIAFRLPVSVMLIMSTVTIMTMYYAWNEFLFATILVDRSSLRTIPVGLMVFRDGLMTEWGVVMAGMVISCLPLIVVYLCMSRNFIRGLTAGAVKG